MAWLRRLACCSAFKNALAALVAGVVLHYANWRTVFFVGILPALITLWIQGRVPESEMWREHHRLAVDSRRVAEVQAAYDHASFVRIFQSPYVRHTLVETRNSKLIHSIGSTIGPCSPAPSGNCTMTIAESTMTIPSI